MTPGSQFALEYAKGFAIMDSSNAIPCSCLLFKWRGMRSIKALLWFHKEVIYLPQRTKFPIFCLFQLLLGWKGERAEKPGECPAKPQFAGTYRAAASRFLVKGFPVRFGDHCWAEQVTHKGGDRKSRSQGEVLEGPPCNSFVEGLGLSTAQVSWETLKDTFSLSVMGLIKIQKFSLYTLFSPGTA